MTFNTDKNNNVSIEGLKIYVLMKVIPEKSLNQNPYIEGEQTKQWPKEKVQYKRTNNDQQNIHMKLKIE
jgi:hypothetical protein